MPFTEKELLGVRRPLKNFCISLTGRHDRADDLLQEAMMKAWAKQDTYQSGTNFKAWIFTIARNEFYTQMRKEGRLVLGGTADEVDQSLSNVFYRNGLHSKPQQVAHLEYEELKREIARLPEDQQRALFLIADRYSYEEAAAMEHCAVGTIKSRVSRARSRLTETLDAVPAPKAA